jgi:cytoskeletal protein CcmA (bactofilin family)
METPKTVEFAHIGKSVIIKGELSGSEDLYVDGQVEGSIELSGNKLIIGPHGQVRANVNAKGVIVQGKLEGNIRASERAELTKSAIAVGDIVTQRVAIEEGAYFKGKVDIQREMSKTDGKPASASAVAGSGSAGGGSAVAHDFAVGGIALAAHANDHLARVFAQNSVFFRCATMLTDHAMALVWLPLALTVWQLLSLRRTTGTNG